MNSLKEIIEKWYKKCAFPEEMSARFYELLAEFDMEEINAESVDLSGALGEKTALVVLYLFEVMEKEYIKRKIDFSHFERALSGMRGRIERAYMKNGSFDIGSAVWDRLRLMGREFRIGRLAYGLGKSPCDVPSKNIMKGDNVLQLHIPGGEPLLYDACVESIESAKRFVADHFPDFEYRYITCLSWVLDDSVADLLGQGSNVLKFATLFEIVAKNQSDNIIRFVFGGGATRDKLPDIAPVGRFQTALRESAMAGRVFYDARGVIDVLKNS